VLVLVVLVVVVLVVVVPVLVVLVVVVPVVVVLVVVPGGWRTGAERGALVFSIFPGHLCAVWVRGVGVRVRVWGCGSLPE